MLNLTAMLQTAIALDNQQAALVEPPVGPATRLELAMTNLTLALAQVAAAQGWPTAGQPGSPKVAPVQDQQRAYVTALNAALVFAARKQWTHLVVLDAAGWDQLMQAPAGTKLADQAKAYLASQNFFLQSYFSHRQADFVHGWHLLLKFGLVDAGWSAATIAAAWEAWQTSVAADLAATED